MRHYSHWVAPFGDPRIVVCLRLPEAFRRSLRPSSALYAKTSAVRSCSFNHIHLSMVLLRTVNQVFPINSSDLINLRYHNFSERPICLSICYSVFKEQSELPLSQVIPQNQTGILASKGSSSF